MPGETIIDILRTNETMNALVHRHGYSARGLPADHEQIGRANARSDLDHDRWFLLGWLLLGTLVDGSRLGKPGTFVR
jgi:hypothetical protein